MRAALALALLVVVAGCAAPVRPPTADPVLDNPSGRQDPVGDPLGWEAGYWSNDPLAIDQSDGLNASERRAFVARTMARVERIRGLEFHEQVPVDVISREEFAERAGGGGPSANESAFDNVRYEAAMLIGEDRNVTEVFSELYGGTVLGFYSPREGAIVIVSDAETPAIDRATLAHELVHALQDQHFGLAGGGRSTDARMAHDGLIEGDASLVEQHYGERCANATWSCVPRPEGGGPASLPAGTVGLYLTIFAPYAEGPNFVHRVRQRGGWAAVNAMYRDRPTTTEQIIHPEAYPGEGPRDVRVPDRSSASWEHFDLDRDWDRLGEATLFAMFWYQRTVPRESLREDVEPYATYDYDAAPSAGWAGDRLVPYRDGDRLGYVWRVAWDSESDAREFRDAYRRTLVDRLNATRVREGVYRVEDRPFADAFRVTRRGDVVVIVNAPTVAELEAVHAPRD